MSIVDVLPFLPPDTRIVADLVAILLTYPQDAEVWIAGGDSPFAKFLRFEKDPDQPDAAYLLIETSAATEPPVTQLRTDAP